jgi:hypothetical protein
MDNPESHHTAEHLELSRRHHLRYTGILIPLACCLFAAAIIYADFIRRAMTPDAALAGSIVVHFIAFLLFVQAFASFRTAQSTRGTRLQLEQDRITLTEHKTPTTIQLDEITRIAPASAPLAGACLAVFTPRQTLRIPFALQGIGRLTATLKTTLDRHSPAEAYNPAALHRFYLRAEHADRAALRLRAHFTRLAALTLAAAFIGACLAVTTMPHEETGLLALIWIGVWTVAASAGPTIGWTLAESIFMNDLFRATDPASLISPPRDGEAERTTYLRCAIFVAALYAALSVTLSYTRYL